MKIAYGGMNLRPWEFKLYSLREWHLAYKGYVEKEYGSQQTPMSHNRLNKMMKEYPDNGHDGKTN